MALWQSIPFVCILLPLGSAAATSILKKRPARVWTCFVLTLLVVLSIVFLVIMSQYGGSYNYRMGHYDAPWGNEIRASLTEALTAQFFLIVMLLSFLGGLRKLDEDVLPDRQNLYCVMLLLMTSALMAEVYTNDIFTAYVFVEIMTIAAAALIAARAKGRTLVAATRYMIMNLIGSGLFLLGIILLYSLTGHLLMADMHRAIVENVSAGSYHLPMTIAVAFITIGLCAKSALFPFHTWVPDAYSFGTPTSSAILSSLVSKAYIFLLIKIYYRVIGLDIVNQLGIDNVLFIFAVIAMIMGSVDAIRQTDIRRMIALSSVAQIGYVYMGIGLASEDGFTAALFHVFAHSVCKSMLFIASSGLIDASGGIKDFHNLRGSGHRAPLSGIAFTVGAFSMVGIPFLGGFITKINFAQAAMSYGGLHMWAVLISLAISTSLNTMYFLRAFITLYRKPADDVVYPASFRHSGKLYASALIGFILLNVALGVLAAPMISSIRSAWGYFG